jgi:dipeptidyl aminopeptidase/acylaminoacyl peptidase
MSRLPAIGLALLLAWGGTASAQQRLDLARVIELLDENGRIALDGGNVLLLTYDYAVEDEKVEAIAFRPAADGRYPAVLLVPGHARTARDFIPLGLRFAKAGFAAVAVSQRGFGRSAGEPDFVGPRTIHALEAGFRRFRKESYVDSARMGVFGYSRGATAAALLAVRLKRTELRAAIFAAGVYDFRKAYDDTRVPGIRENMEREAGSSDAAALERTPIARMADVPCPVLILHGEKDENAPVSQAHLLRDRLTGLEKQVELRTFADKGHDIGPQNLFDHTLAFLQRALPAESPKPQAP